MDKPLSVLLVTANVGSMFEQPSQIEETWLRQLCNVISERQPQLVALHCQEVGGKHFDQCINQIDRFQDLLINSSALKPFRRMRSFIDKTCHNPEEFTAMGNVYFLHDDLEDVAMWDFTGNRFHPIEGQLFTDAKQTPSSRHVFHRKEKFPSHICPDHPKSRKGFLRTRWRLDGRELDLVNVHLYHDADNLQAAEKSPSSFALNRRQALAYTIGRLTDVLQTSPVFVFGDFNFRLDLCDLLQVHFDKCGKHHAETSDGDLIRTEYSHPDDNAAVVLTLERKVFSVLADMLDFGQGHKEMRIFDKEPDEFPALSEIPLKFPPSYPFNESGDFRSYMQTRCPAWCDRVFFNRLSAELLMQAENVSYEMLGPDVCMGDHKPVFLAFVLPAEKKQQDYLDKTERTAVSTSPGDSLERRISDDTPHAENDDPQRDDPHHDHGQASTNHEDHSRKWHGVTVAVSALALGVSLAVPLKYGLGIGWVGAGAMSLAMTVSVIKLAQHNVNL